MHDFETLVGELLGSRPELTREEVMRRISEKKETVGAGYLTDQGALFLVAGELGVTLQRTVASSDITIRDLYIGANDVTTIARVLAVYPVSTYKKKDGGEGKYRRLVLFDGRDTVKFTLWDEKAEDIDRLGLAIGNAVKVANGYVRQGLDGKPNLSLGKRGSLEAVPESEISTRLATLSTVTEKLAKLSQEKPFAAVECVVESEPRYSEFVRSDGSAGSLFQFGVSGDRGSKTRVVIWSPAERPELEPGQRVVVTNVRSRRTSNGEFELHGDAGSLVLPGGKREPILLRVVAINKGVKGTVLLAVDKDKRVRLVEAGNDNSTVVKGAVVNALPESESDGRLVCRNRGSIEVASGVEFPELPDLVTKLKDAKDEAAQIMVEVIALSHGSAEELHLKDGSTAKKGELVVGDDTSEMRFVGWREQADRFPAIQPGERLRISGVSPKLMRVGGWVLQSNVITTIEKLNVGD